MKIAIRLLSRDQLPRYHPQQLLHALGVLRWENSGSLEASLPGSILRSCPMLCQESHGHSSASTDLGLVFTQHGIAAKMCLETDPGGGTHSSSPWLSSPGIRFPLKTQQNLLISSSS